VLAPEGLPSVSERANGTTPAPACRIVRYMTVAKASDSDVEVTGTYIGKAALRGTEIRRNVVSHGDRVVARPAQCLIHNYAALLQIKEGRRPICPKRPSRFPLRVL